MKAPGYYWIPLFSGTSGRGVGVIPVQDYAFLRAAGVEEIFGPGTNVLDAAHAVLAVAEGKRRNR